NDVHLDFRTSLLIIEEQGRKQLAISSYVDTHNLLGRLYFSIVRPLHRLIAPAMLKMTLRRLERMTRP
ncbi:MAG: DUF2867 domain-containing protein, partial [Xanthomonadaceae bacterium]|nr:DUF2867 domain-containing protein [Xanthomonadaceae bacterium]